MPNDEQMTQVIEDSITDAGLSDTSTDTTLETTTETPETVQEGTETPEGTSGPGSPATRTEEPQAATDAYAAFAKEHGIPPQTPGQRENRLPYSRVKAIVDKAQKKAAEPYVKELETYKGKVGEYEGYLNNVQKFEDIMKNNHMQFLKMLVQIPGYQEIFQQLAGSQAKPAPADGAVAETAPVGDGMPEPDMQLADGTAVYSLEGLRKRDEWHAEQVEKRIMGKVQKDYAPLKQAWETGNYRAEKLRDVQRQLADARTWEQFAENETEIGKALEAYPQLSLEGAYRYVVIPKLKAERNTMRQELMAEVKKAPTSTSAPSQITKPGAGGGKRTVEQIINDSIDRLESRK